MHYPALAVLFGGGVPRLRAVGGPQRITRQGSPLKRKFGPAYLLTLVNILGFSLMLPVLPFVVERYGGSDAMYGFLLSAYAAFQFVGAPWLGRLSDSVGRKPVLMISHTGTLLSWVIFGAAWFLPDVSIWFMSVPLLVIAVSRVLDGITGGNGAVTQAYVSDLATREEKGWVFGTIGGIVGLGMMIGPAAGGFLASTPIGYLGVAIAGGALSAFTLVSMFTSLRETLPPEARKPSEPQPLADSVRLIRRIVRLDPSPVIKRLFLLRAIYSAMMASYISTIALFVIDVFHFDERELGAYMLMVGVFIAFNQAVLAKMFVRKIGEWATLRLGLLCSALGLFTITLTDVLWLYIVFYYVLNLGISLTIPNFMGLTAQHARDEQMGEVMGIANGIISLSNAVFPIMAATVYGLIGTGFYHVLTVLPLAALFLARRTQAPTPSEGEPAA